LRHGRRLVLLHDQSARRHSLAGVTSNLPRRAYKHREGLVEGFTKRYGLKMLVYREHYDDIRLAIQREKTVKHWPRAWKVRLIHAANPEWNDLYGTLI
jgi:putative endonuclease